MELVDSQALLEWLANNYKTFGATLEIITDKSQEGSQFVRGFGGIGGKFERVKFMEVANCALLICFGVSCVCSWNIYCGTGTVFHIIMRTICPIHTSTTTNLC
jgi:eRF1 domain 3